MAVLERETPTSIGLTDGKGRNIVGIIDHLRTTPYGEKLQKSVRYGNQKPHDVPNELWVKCLGADVDNFEHMRLVYGLTRVFVSHMPRDYFTQFEKEILLLTAAVHDIGEYRYGDIPAPQKTKYDEAKEMEVLGEILQEVFPKDEVVVSEVLSVIQSRHSKLGRVFDAVEKIGHARTAIRGWRKFKEVKDNEGLKEGLFRVSFTLLDTDPQTGKTFIEDLIEFSSDYEPVRLFLDGNIRAVTEIIDTPMNPRRNKENFETARAAWLRFLNILLPLDVSPVPILSDSPF